MGPSGYRQDSPVGTCKLGTAWPGSDLDTMAALADISALS